jgi:MFS superfamily sulfate permease-like transporter
VPILLTCLVGTFSYATARERVARATPRDDDPHIIVFDLSRLGHLDVSAALAIDELLEMRARDGRVLLLAGADAPQTRMLQDLGILDRVARERQFTTVETALAYAIEAGQD